MATETRTRTGFSIEAIKYPQFNVYWFSGMAAVGGENIRLIAHFWLAWELSKSNFFLGAVGLATGIPSLLSVLISGQVADRLNRRNLIVFTHILVATAMATLGVLVATDLVARWHVLFVAAIIGVVQTFYVTTRQAIMPRLIETRAISSAVAMDNATWQASRVIAPAIAAGLIKLGGGSAFFAVAFANILAAFIFLRLPSAVGFVEGKTLQGLRAFADGVSYVRKHNIISTLTVLSLALGFFGTSFSILLPSFADDVYDTGSTGFAVLTLCYGIGSLIGTVVIAGLRDVPNRGLLIFVGAGAFAALETAFALSDYFSLALGLLVLNGLAYALFINFANAEVQRRVPDELRGRVMGIYSLTWLLIPLGGFSAGLIASGLGPQGAIAINGGVLLGITLLLATAFPRARELAQEQPARV